MLAQPVYCWVIHGFVIIHTDPEDLFDDRVSPHVMSQGEFLMDFDEYISRHPPIHDSESFLC